MSVVKWRLTNVSTTGRCQPDIIRRISIASTAMHSMNKDWRQTRLQLRTKLRLYQTCILSILLYGSETWTLLQEDLRKLEVFHMHSQRMILGIRWHDFVRNTEVVDRTNLPCVQDIIAKRQNSLFGHVVRLDDHTPAQGALITGCSSQNWPPLWSWLAATARTPAPFMDPADRRRYTFQHSCRMVQGSSSWPLWVDATDLCCLHDLMMMMMLLLR